MLHETKGIVKCKGIDFCNKIGICRNLLSPDIFYGGQNSVNKLLYRMVVIIVHIRQVDSVK